MAPCLQSKDNQKTKTCKIKKHLLLLSAETHLPISIKSSLRSNLLYLKGQSISLIPKPNFKSLIRNNSKINKKSCCKKSMGQSLVWVELHQLTESEQIVQLPEQSPERLLAHNSNNPKVHFDSCRKLTQTLIDNFLPNQSRIKPKYQTIKLWSTLRPITIDHKLQT